MVWLITGLLLALFGGLVVLTRRARRRPATDETLIEDLLGLPAGQAQLAPPEHEDAPPPVPAAQPADEANWLETQLTLITAWSERMQEQIASWAADADPPPVKPVPETAARPADVSRRADHEPREPPQPRPAPGRCIATTAKGSQCKRTARPGGATCAVHAQRAHS